MSGTPIAVYPNATTAAEDALDAALTGRVEPYASGFSISAIKPETGSALPVVQVANDGGQVVYPVVTRPLMRVTVWHDGELHAHDLAQLCQGILLAHSGDEIAACYPISSPVGDMDPGTEIFFSTFTVRAVLKAQLI